MTTKGPLEDKRELLVRHVIPALDAGMALLHRYLRRIKDKKDEEYQ